MMRLGFWLLLLAACPLVAGCFSEGEPPSPRALPYVLEPALELKANPHPVDLDGDGVDEILYRYTPSGRPPGVMAVWMQTQSGATIEQVNFQGKLLPLHTRDLNRDGTPEVLVPFTRNDSLFVSAVEARGRKLFTFFLISGEPRQEPDGVLPWDPVVRNFYLADVDADGSDDLITIVFTAFARLPRGVLVHRLPGGKPIGRRIVGAALAESVFTDAKVVR